MFPWSIVFSLFGKRRGQAERGPRRGLDDGDPEVAEPPSFEIILFLVSYATAHSLIYFSVFFLGALW